MTEIHNNNGLQGFLDLYPAILRKAFWFCDRNWFDAEDITQDAFLTICQNYGQYSPELSGKYAWCVRILLNAYLNKFKRRKVDQIPMRRLFHRGEQLENMTTQMKPWSDTTRKVIPSEWGKRWVNGKIKACALGQRNQANVDFWFKGITRDNLKNYLCLHLDDDTLRKLKTLSEKMFRTKFLIGLGFKREEIAEKEGVTLATIKGRVRAANDKINFGRIRNWGKRLHAAEAWSENFEKCDKTYAP